MNGRRCTFVKHGGRPCGATPLRAGAFCFWHEPGKEEEAAEARRLGGLRRRKERTIAGAYDLGGLGDVEALRRILDVVVIDLLGLENSIARARALVATVVAAAKLVEMGDVQVRLAILEAAVLRRVRRRDEPGGNGPLGGSDDLGGEGPR